MPDDHMGSHLQGTPSSSNFLLEFVACFTLWSAVLICMGPEVRVSMKPQNVETLNSATKPGNVMKKKNYEKTATLLSPKRTIIAELG